jgi:long-chain acyl-CoA synthetase
LKGFEVVRAVHVHPELFTVENDLLTPTLKLKRHQASKHFKIPLDQMYAETKIA